MSAAVFACLPCRRHAFCTGKHGERPEITEIVLPHWSCLSAEVDAHKTETFSTDASAYLPRLSRKASRFCAEREKPKGFHLVPFFSGYS